MRKLLLANGGWLLRVVTITALFAVIALSLLPRVFSHISTSATVNARIMVIRSPIEGVIEEYGLVTGAPVSRGQTLVVFREADTDQTQLADLEARLRISEAAASAVADRIGAVEAIRSELVRRQSVYAAWHADILTKEVEEIEAQIRGADARLRSAGLDAARKKLLRERGVLPTSDLTETTNRREELLERVRELEARRDGRRLMLRALEDGVLAGTTGTNTPYTLQRQDEIGLELARLRDELADHRAEQAALRDQIVKEREIYEHENRVTLVSPVSGVIWRSAALTGRPVLPGDEVIEILDCGARFLEAYLPESLMGTISPGDRVEVRLTGESRVFSAPVISVLGNSAQFDHADLAARDVAPKSGKMRVLVEVDAATLGPDAGKFCHVGRTAQVSLPRDLPGLETVAARFGATVEVVSSWLASATGRALRG